MGYGHLYDIGCQSVSLLCEVGIVEVADIQVEKMLVLDGIIMRCDRFEVPKDMSCRDIDGARVLGVPLDLETLFVDV